MAAAAILETLWRAGLSVTLTDTDQLKIQPASHLQPAQRELLRANKPEIVAFLHEAHATSVLLLEAAMRRCDHFKDGEKARDAMRADCLATPMHLRQDLLDYLNSVKGTP